MLHRIGDSIVDCQPKSINEIAQMECGAVNEVVCGQHDCCLSLFASLFYCINSATNSKQ